jgi:hypothetical protein
MALDWGFKMNQQPKKCRHFDSRASVIGNMPCCAIGHPIRKIVIAANGGSNEGIAFMFPCRPTPRQKANCPNYDPKTDIEIEADRAEMSARMDLFVKALPIFVLLRSRMAEQKTHRAIIDCPFCGAVDKMNVACAIGYNNHLSAVCSACNESFRE